MATVLCVWEQGGNLGHLSNLRQPIEIALELGHRVVLAARELHRVPEALAGLRIELLPAPFKQNVQPADQSAFLSFTHILARQCFSTVAELESYLRAWLCIFDLVKPDLVLYDHSPTALVASHGRSFKKVALGSGFYNPPGPAPGAPFAPFSTTTLTPEVLTRLAADEAQVLGMVNQARVQLALAPLAALADLYHQLDVRLFLTWPELDHFGARPGQRYLGNQTLATHQLAKWPGVSGPKVFGYLQNMPSLEALLRDLRASGVRALLWVSDLPPKLRQAYSSERLQFLDQLVDMNSVGAQADWAISHSNHSTVGTLMMAGLPQLLIPRHQEQLLMARRLVAQGCALLAYQDQPGFAKEINAFLTNPALRTNAATLAHTCRQRGDPDAKGYIRAALQTLLPAAGTDKLPLEKTFTEMAQEQANKSEDWSDLEGLSADGLDRLT